MSNRDQPLSLKAEEAGLDVEPRTSLAAEEGAFLGFEQFNLKRRIALWFLGAFILSNGIVIGLVIVLLWAEWNATSGGREIERLITSEVIMALIGATTVQLGAIVFAMARHFFPGTGE